MTANNRDLIQKLNDLNNTLKQLRQFKISRLALIDPNSGQGKVLSILKNGTLSQTDLVTQLDMQRQSASELIRKLEKKGLLSRVKSETDKRVFQVSLTEQGVAAAERLSVNEEDYLNALSPEQKAAFDDILNILLQETDAQYEIAKDNFGANIFGDELSSQVQRLS